MRRGLLAVASFTVAVGLLGAMAGTASAEQPSGHYFTKSNSCGPVGIAAPQFNSTANPSTVNQQIREDRATCGKQIDVTTGVIWD